MKLFDFFKKLKNTLKCMNCDKKTRIKRMKRIKMKQMKKTKKTKKTKKGGWGNAKPSIGSAPLQGPGQVEKVQIKNVLNPMLTISSIP